MYWKNSYFGLSGAFNIRSFLDANLVPTWLRIGIQVHKIPSKNRSLEFGIDFFRHLGSIVDGTTVHK